MGPVEATRICLSNYASISGHASRSEFWWFAAPWFVGTSLLVLLAGNLVAAGFFGLLLLVLIALNVPFCPVAIRGHSDIRRLESRASLVGWGLSGLLAGPCLYRIRDGIVRRNGQVWMVAAMIIAPIVGLIALVYSLSARSQPVPSITEVSK